MELGSKDTFFPSLDDKPVDPDATEFERIVREVLARLRPSLEDIVGAIARERLSQYMELVRMMLQEVDELSREVRERLEVRHDGEADDDQRKRASTSGGSLR